MSAICRFIHAEKANYPIVLLCKAMKTGRSTYYAWVAGAAAREARRRADEALAHEITVIHIASRRNYGVPRITAELRRHGGAVNHKRVERVMRKYGIAGNSRRTSSSPRYRESPRTSISRVFAVLTARTATKGASFALGRGLFARPFGRPYRHSLPVRSWTPTIRQACALLIP
ncbi:IS3 family transposase (plasmid) [Streptomyces sp. JL4002]